MRNSIRGSSKRPAPRSKIAQRTKRAATRPFAVEILEDRRVLDGSPFAIGGDPRVDPDDFRVTTFASGLQFPYSMQVLFDGSLLFGSSRPAGSSFFNSTGELVRLVDADNDGVADGPGSVLFTGLPGRVTEVRQAGNLLFVTSSQSGSERISMLRAGATAADPLTLLGSVNFAFPAGWQHTTYALAVRPTPGQAGDFDIFFNCGSQDNETLTTATVPISGLLSGALQGDAIYKFTVHDTGGVPVVSNLTQIAAGLRNAAGLVFQAGTGDLYFEDNGIDGLADPNEPLSADELNRIAAADIGGAVENFGFPNDYIEYRTGVHIGSGGIQPLFAFQPLPDPFTGSESEGPAQIAFAPPDWPTGLSDGVFVGFHGRFNAGGLANEENPLVYADLNNGQYFQFIGNGEANVGHIDGLLATQDSLFLADLTTTGSMSNSPAKGVIYQIKRINNGPPTAAVTGPTDGFSGVAGQLRAFTLEATDPTSLDPDQEFTFEIDWGDDSGASVTSPSGVQTSHTYELAGSYVITVTATDEDGNESPPVEFPVNIIEVEQQGAMLAVGATSGADTFLIDPGPASGQIRVGVNGASLGTFATSQALFFGGDGADSIAINGAAQADTFTIQNTSVNFRGSTLGGASLESWTVDGREGGDTFKLEGNLPGGMFKGGAGSDRFTLATGLAFSGAVEGNGDSDTLTAGNMANAWSFTGAGAGTLNGAPISGIEKATGGSAADTFSLTADGGLSGVLNGGGGPDTLDYASFGGAVTANLQTKIATSLGGFASIESFAGGSFANTLVGPNKTTQWQVTATDAGKVGGVNFSGFPNLTGGAGDDSFRLDNGFGVGGLIDGGPGVNTLDYSKYTTGVTIDLGAAAATLIGGIARIQNVTGGSGADVLTGDSADNLLRGNAGADTLTGGGGHDILVGGAGNDELMGGDLASLLLGGAGIDTVSGGLASDLLIGGTTTFDAKVAALMAIMAEWKRTDATYVQRIDHLRGAVAGGLNGAFFLNTTTVREDSSTDALQGGIGLDWFWGQLAELLDPQLGEQRN